MNILYLTNHLNVGGITSYVLTLASGIKQRGHNVFVASSSGQLIHRFIEEGIDYIYIPIKTKSEVSPKILLSLFKLRRFINEKNIDIIHSHTRVTQVLGCLIQHYFHKPHISTCHGFFKKRFSRILFPCWGLKVIAISPSVKEHLLQDFKVKEKNIKVIYNGIDLNRFNPLTSPVLKVEIKKSLRLGDGPIIGIVARLSDVKGHIYLLQAMKIILDHLPRAQLLIVGEGKMEDELLKLTRDLRIENNIFFMPEVHDTKKVLSIMDLFVMPSLKEGLGLALMEAMASGLAVIGSDVGGIRNLIQDGENGLLVEPGDSNAISQAILEILQNPEKKKLLGKAARKFISENFSQEKMVLQTEKVYLECLSARY